MEYHLVYVLVWSDVMLPLVLSQTFDQAYTQRQLKGDAKPASVSVWILTPMRYFLSGKHQARIDEIRKRCPGVSIRLVPEINRLNRFPAALVLKKYRNTLKEYMAVFHFRGETSFNGFRDLFTKSRLDRFILDVRGYWPAEFLYRQNIDSVDHVPVQFQGAYNTAINNLKKAVCSADGVITVSENLADLLKSTVPELENLNVVPCCVKQLNDQSKRNAIRNQLNVLPGESLLVYSGGYARYQHLEDLTIPFLHEMVNRNSLVKVLILSHDIARIRGIVESTGSGERFIFKSVPQRDVGDYLSACDLGFLLRRETLVNRVAQPVKVGEYLAAGVPVCVEGEVGGVTHKLTSYDAGISIHIAERSKPEWDEEITTVLNFLKKNRREDAQRLAKEYFLWDGNVIKQRSFYTALLNRNIDLTFNE